MFDTMTLTKIAGGVCGALLIFLLGKWAAEEMYHMGGGHGGQAAYVIETGAEDVVADVVEVDLGAMMASADIAKGAKVFKKCGACHKIAEGANGTGPSLYGVVGRDIAALDGFGYSGALTGLEGDWDVAALDGFLTKPKTYAPGTTMGFSGLKKVADRVNLIAYLDSLDD